MPIFFWMLGRSTSYQPSTGAIALGVLIAFIAGIRPTAANANSVASSDDPVRQVHVGEAVAAVSQPATVPIVQPVRQPIGQPTYRTEDELIQQMTGKATAPTSNADRALPVFSSAPSTVSAGAASAPTPVTDARSPQVRPPSFLVTAGTNSDLPLNLLAPAAPTQQSCGESCQPTPQPIPITDASSVTGSAFWGKFSSDSSVPTVRDTVSLQSGTEAVQTPTPNRRGFLRSTALRSPSLTLQGVYLNEGGNSSARARLTGEYPLTPRALFGATLDLTDGNAFTDSPDQGLSINELYLAVAPIQDLPNFRLVVGQLDLTSYFDRNSFAKDGASQFFNPVFQTNPALSATSIASRPGALVNWTLNETLEAKAAVFSSSRRLGDFALDGFAGELGLRYGNAIIRGTYATARDAGSDSGFREIFGVNRGNGNFGLQEGDREESYGVNGEVFIPNLKLGLFARYGRYNNRDADLGGDTYSVGLTFLDLLTPNDRLGLAYGRELSNDKLRRQSDDRTPDVLELFYDFPFLANLRLGLSLQERDNFSELVAGFRIRSEFDVTPKRSVFR